jgi:type II secretory pathway pseudopilin PulG
MDAPPPASPPAGAPPPGYPPPGYPPPGYYPPPPGYGYPPPKKSSLLWLWILLGVLGGVMVLGILAAVAIPSFLEYQQKAKRPEAQLMLNKIGRSARTYYYETSQFPTQASGPTPSRPCCEYPQHKCPVDPSSWAIEPWMTLDIEPYESTYYQFAYTPDPGGQGFTATATGDLDCDGNEVVYTVRGRAVAGDPTLEFENPTNRD